MVLLVKTKLYLVVMKHFGRDGLAGKMLGDGDVITGILHSQFCCHMICVLLKVIVLYTKLHSKTVSGGKKKSGVGACSLKTLTVRHFKRWKPNKNSSTVLYVLNG